MMNQTAYVNKIIDMSVVDGPGNRTSIFLQGCNFDCFYCHNPETIHRCIHCSDCVEVCPTKALTWDEVPCEAEHLPSKKVIWNESLCINCDACIKACKHLSSPKVKEISVETIVERLKENRPFIQGITTSGGECTLQHPFLTALFRETKKLGLTNFVDTNGSLDLEKLDDFLEVSDQFMLDLKATHPRNHLLITKQNNDLVLKNAAFLASINKLYELRTVVIAGMDNQQTILDATKLLEKWLPHQPLRYKLIAYRPFGVREEFSHFSSPSKEDMQELKNLATSKGFGQVIIV